MYIVAKILNKIKMKNIQIIPVESILFDKLPLNRKTFALANYIDNGGQIPAIKVRVSSKGGYELKDGRHRLAAMKLTGNIWIEAYISYELTITV